MRWIPACAHYCPEDIDAGFIDSATGQFIDFDKENISENIQRHWIPAYAGMTVVVVATVKFPPSSRRRPGSSVFRCTPEKIPLCALKSMNSRIKLRPIPCLKNLPDSSGRRPGSIAVKSRSFESPQIAIRTALRRRNTEVLVSRRRCNTPARRAL